MRRVLIGILLITAVFVGAASTAGPLAAPPTAPDLSAKPTKLGFGRVTVGTESKFKSVTIMNRTDSRMRLDYIATNAGTPAGFGFASQNCGAVAAHDSCTSDMVFNPTALGKVTGTSTMTFNSDAGGTYTVSFAVSGTGI